MLLLAMCISTLAFCQQMEKFAAFSAQKKTIKLSTGITMKYVDTGNKKGEPVLLLHGSSDTGRSYQLTIEELIKINPNLRIIAPDLRGHGETSMPDEKSCASAPEKCFTPAAFASDIIALMDQLNISQAHIVGHSMGSVITQELVLNYENRIKSIVLIGTFANGKEAQGIHQFILPEIIDKNFKSALVKQKGNNIQWPKDAYRVTAKDLGPEITTFLKDNWVVELGTDKAYLEAIYQETIQVPIGTWIGMMRALGNMDNREALADVKIPTLVLNAIQDMIVLEADQMQVKAALEKATKKHGTTFIYKTYGKTPLPESGLQESDFGHNLQWSASKQVAADISSFINNGYPVKELPYINPNNSKQILIQTTQVNIIEYSRKN